MIQLVWGIIYGLIVGLGAGFCIGNANGIALCQLNHHTEEK